MSLNSKAKKRKPAGPRRRGRQADQAVLMLKALAPFLTDHQRQELVDASVDLAGRQA